MKKCKMCGIIRREKEEFLYDDNEIAIVNTKNMKGHHKRIMVITKEHIKELDPNTEKDYLHIFTKFCQEYFNEEPTFCLNDPTYATYPEHWHRVACDWITDDPKELRQLHYTPHESIRTKIAWNP